MKYTMNELDEAGRWAFDFNGTYEIIKQHRGRPSAHREACAQCFLDDLHGPNADILRAAMKDLNEKGFYCPSDKVWVD